MTENSIPSLTNYVVCLSNLPCCIDKTMSKCCYSLKIRLKCHDSGRSLFVARYAISPRSKMLLVRWCNHSNHRNIGNHKINSNVITLLITAAVANKPTVTSLIPLVTLLTKITINALGHQATCMLFLSDFNHNWNA
jgi:hypothetical protein